MIASPISFFAVNVQSVIDLYLEFKVLPSRIPSAQ